MRTSLYFVCLLFSCLNQSSFAHAENANLPNMVQPVLGSLIPQEETSNQKKFILTAAGTKAYSPIDGFIFYVGNIKGYGLSVIVKNAHKMSIIGNLDRATVLKEQYVMSGDRIGSVVYNSKITFIVQNVRKQQQDFDPNILKKFQNKLIEFAKNGGNFVQSSIAESTSHGGRLNFNQVTSLLKDAGFPTKTIPTMFCIAQMESGLNPKALNYNTNNTVDVGLFQINSIWFKKCNTDIAVLYDEKENSRCAYMVYKNQGFSAWVTYNKLKNTSYCNI
jgi:hypothetical protein